MRAAVRRRDRCVNKSRIKVEKLNVSRNETSAHRQEVKVFDMFIKFSKARKVQAIVKYENRTGDVYKD